MGHEQKSAGSASVLLLKTFILHCGNDRFTCASRRNNQIPGIATDSALSLQLIQNLLLIGVGLDVHGVNLGIVAVEILFGLQSTSKAFPLPLVVILELLVVPIEFEGSRNLIDRFRLKYVVDYLKFDFGSYTFPIFNFADICAVVGTVLLICIIIFGSKYFESFWSLLFAKRKNGNAG